MVKSKSNIFVAGLLVVTASLTGCYEVNKKADNYSKTSEDAGTEYAPQMYHSEPYDPMSQITDKNSGLNYWPYDPVGNKGNEHGEWYNSNYFNPYGMNMRVPANNSIARGQTNYYVSATDFDGADALPDRTIKEFNAEESQKSYERYCSHCHGKELDGKGPVAEKFKGVANLMSATMKARTESYIFHVITHGKNNMKSHAAQVSQEDRWKIAAYIKSKHNEGAEGAAPVADSTAQ